MVDKLKNLDLVSTMKALEAGANYFKQRIFYSPDDLTFGRTRILKGKHRQQAWFEVLDMFIDFLRQLFLDKRDMRSDHGSQAVHIGGKRHDRLIPFKVRDIGKCIIETDLMQMVAEHRGIMSILISSFELNKAVSIIEDRQNESADDLLMMRVLQKTDPSVKIKEGI